MEISLGQIEQMFSKIKKDTNWNIYGEMMRQYFFVSSIEKNLLSIEEKMISLGYTCSEVQENDIDQFSLGVTKNEKHTENSLYLRNTELYKLANEFGVEYDGFDVENMKV